MLDFSTSLFVGAYFAVGTLNDHDHASIWAINQDYMTQNFERKRDEHRPPIKLTASADLIAAAINRDIAFAAAKTAGPVRQNRRLLQQQGLFVFPLDINQPFLTNLLEMFQPRPKVVSTAPKPISDMKHPDEFAIIKFVIDKSDFVQFRADLREMNISTETLFPDLDGEARALADIVTKQVALKSVV